VCLCERTTLETKKLNPDQTRATGDQINSGKLVNDKERGAGEQAIDGQSRNKKGVRLCSHRLMTHGGFGLFATLFRETLVPCRAAGLVVDRLAHP
jgi:hypothetical protein